jgi:ABC-type phosphate transport system substrate-binding protein
MQTLLAIVLAVFSTLAGAQELVVIVNPSNATSSMTVDQVEQIFLGKTTALPSGAIANAVDLAEGSPVRDEFYLKVTARSRAQVKAVWARLMFSGKCRPPKELDSAADVKKYVAANANGIGYIEKSAADASVRVVLSIP